ncbi:MAG TPA: AraC family transcriptional regulator [Thiobacillus sp.]|nr:AraC family transcriptional regulator [Thiobacillus sp.]
MPALRTFYLWPDLAVYIGAALPSDLHRHFAVQVCLGLDGPFALRANEGEPWRSYTAALIPSGALHQTDARPTRFAMIYFAPASPFMRAAQGLASNDEGISPISKSAAKTAIAVLRTAQDQPAAIRRAIESLFHERGNVQRDPVDPRITLALDILAGHPETGPALPELAQRVGLSASRFRHLFRDAMGSSFSAYRLWNRTVLACRLLAIRPDLTWAAHKAGFADSAHFSRAFHRTFGLTPSDIFKSGDFSFAVCT